jgi:hypothetical protein
LQLDRSTSKAIFARDHRIARIDVSLEPGRVPG